MDCLIVKLKYYQRNIFKPGLEENEDKLYSAYRHYLSLPTYYSILEFQSILSPIHNLIH